MLAEERRAGEGQSFVVPGERLVLDDEAHARRVLELREELAPYGGTPYTTYEGVPTWSSVQERGRTPLRRASGARSHFDRHLPEGVAGATNAEGLEAFMYFLVGEAFGLACLSLATTKASWSGTRSRRKPEPPVVGMPAVS